ncbi:MAG: NAD(P)H-dependent oxidoreductase [Terrimicrobiaceae bacterium]
MSSRSTHHVKLSNSFWKARLRTPCSATPKPSGGSFFGLRARPDFLSVKAEELKCETKLIDLRDYQLLFCDGKDDESRYPKDVFRLREEVKQAQGIILDTREYHGGYSGVLKNALDLMGFEEFEGKMLGLVGVSDGRWVRSAR